MSVEKSMITKIAVEVVPEHDYNSSDLPHHMKV
jgi:hypothetical protein